MRDCAIRLGGVPTSDTYPGRVRARSAARWVKSGEVPADLPDRIRKPPTSGRHPTMCREVRNEERDGRRALNAAPLQQDYGRQPSALWKPHAIHAMTRIMFRSLNYEPGLLRRLGAPETHHAPASQTHAGQGSHAAQGAATQAVGAYLSELNTPLSSTAPARRCVSHARPVEFHAPVPSSRASPLRSSGCTFVRPCRVQADRVPSQLGPWV